MISVWVIVSLLSNVAIIATEYLNRTYPYFPDAIRRTMPLIVLAQLCLHYSYSRAPSLLMAWIVFTVGNSAMRLTVAGTVMDEPFHAPWAIAGAFCMVMGSYCIKQATG